MERKTRTPKANPHHVPNPERNRVHLFLGLCESLGQTEDVAGIAAYTSVVYPITPEKMLLCVDQALDVLQQFKEAVDAKR